MSVDNTITSIEKEYNSAIEMDDPDGLIQVAMVIIGVLSVSGTIGNALVLYVFARQKQKLSSTIFILTLACTDFATSLVTMPYTIAIELLKYKVEYDAVCKIYQFLVTTTIPFSAFVMVAIAVDRYLCIVHPFKHTMTLKRAKVIVALLVLLAITLGLLCCLMYGTNVKEFTCVKTNFTIDESDFNVTSRYRKVADPEECNSTLEDVSVTIVNKGNCHKDKIIFDESFFVVYQKIYSAFFAVCAVIVIVLYAIIYRSVLTRRRKRLHLTKTCCGFWADTSTADHCNDAEQTEFTTLNNGSKDKVVISGDSPKIGNNPPQLNNKLDVNKVAAASVKGKSDTDALVRPSGVSRAKLEKLRMANIKTALMLSIVALIYIIAFMPAWLMAHQVLPMNVIIFYLYFTYNVANPIIYAFLNQSFRNHLQALIKCKS